MADDLTRPYIGYRSAGRRPEAQQDRRAAADAPLSALRGMLSGVLGAPGDIESLVRMLPGLSERTVLPTSEDVERRLPLRAVSETPVGRVATGAGQLGGGFYTGPGSPLRAVAALPSAVRRAARDFAVAAGQPAVNVIKPKGGNWLAGSVEKAIAPMRVRERTPGVNQHTEEMAASDSALNKWLEGKLTKYIRNEIATPEDPIRALAERGVTHMPGGVEVLERGGSWIPETLGPRRKAAGFPAEGLATTPSGQGWEQLADEAIHNLPARMRVSPETGGGSTKALQIEQENPWLMKVPPDTMTYGAYPVEVRQDLGFEHLVDELRNAINPESGLPRELLWKYSDLDKVTVPQAVERVAKINEWRAAQKAEADMARAMGPATHVFKEYPEQGFKWVELRAPKETGRKISVEKPEMDLPPDMDQRQMREVAEDMAFDEGLDEGTQAFDDFVRDMMTDFNRKKKVEMDESYKALEDALKYEGETMGHCVGGYCPDVIEGRSKIFSLRDKKGQPHVTIEVAPGRFENAWKTLTADEQAAVRKATGSFPSDEQLFEAMKLVVPEKAVIPEDIVQIKGKANRAPNPEYLPAVQDFVRSQQWGRVGDLENAGFIRIDPESELAAAFKKVGKEPPPYVNQGELTNLLKWNRGEGDLPEGFAAGGLVGLHARYAAGGAVAAPATQTAAIPYDEAKIAELASALTA